MLKSEDYKALISTTEDLDPAQIETFLNKQYEKHWQENPSFLLTLRKATIKEEGLAGYPGTTEAQKSLARVHDWIDYRLRIGFEDIEAPLSYDSDTEGAQELFNVLKKLEELFILEGSRANSPADLIGKEAELKALINLMGETSFTENKELVLENADKLYNDLISTNFYASTRDWVLKINNVVAYIKEKGKHASLRNNTKQFQGLPSNLEDPHTAQLSEKFGEKYNLDRAKGLDPEQLALLYSFLRDHKAILPLTNPDLATILHLLTGYSRQNFKADLSSKLNDIKLYKKGKKSVENLLKVKKLLSNVISDIDSEVSKNKTY
jgi:hypothetical protein